MQFLRSFHLSANEKIGKTAMHKRHYSQLKGEKWDFAGALSENKLILRRHNARETPSCAPAAGC